jgi:hypothetical protein
LTAVVTGTSPGEVDVAATAPTSPNANVDTTLRVACLAVENPGTQPACPAAGHSAWRNATSSPQTIPDLTAGDLYSCYAAEFANSPTDTSRVCSTAVIDAVAALNAPTVAASMGTVGGAVLVTGTAPSDANVDAELKVACVEPDGLSGAACPAFDAEGWVNVTESGCRPAGQHAGRRVEHGGRHRVQVLFGRDFDPSQRELWRLLRGRR